MPSNTKVKKRRVMARDHDEIASYINEELKRRADNEYRCQHERRWREVDRQIAMEPPESINENRDEADAGTWSNAIQLGDLTDASETITADMLRLVFPTERKFFVPHVDLGPAGVDAEGNAVPQPPEVQREANGVLRSMMVQQHKDFGVRGRVKLAIKEILHHGSVVATVDDEKIFQYAGGTAPKHLKAPVPEIHSMWNCFPDSSPKIQGTEIFYKGSMIIRKYIPLQDALEMPGWINKDQLQTAHKKEGKKLHDHIEILTYYGDIFLKRHDGNVLFPNRKTVVSGQVFLESTVYRTAYAPIIYTGYERDDVRDPYYTSPIVKRAPMALFASHMANKTMNAVDLAVKPPGQYDSLDNSLKANPPQIYPGAMFPSRGGQGVNFFTVGDPATGLAAMQFAKQSLQEGTTVDATRKGVSPGTEQTATEVIQTEQRAEVREVEFSSSFESGFMLPYLIMQHDLNLIGLEPYRFFNDEPHTPDYLTATRSDLPRKVIFEVTGSRSILGERERTQRFAQTAALSAQTEFTARETNWKEVNRQLWEDSKQKDPERFMVDTNREDDIAQAVNEAVTAVTEQFQQQMQVVQQQVGQLQEQTQKATEEARKQTVRAEQAELKEEQMRLKNVTLADELKLAEKFERAEDQLQRLQRDLDRREARLACKEGEGEQGGGLDPETSAILKSLIGSDEENR